MYVYYIYGYLFLKSKRRKMSDLFFKEGKVSSMNENKKVDISIFNYKMGKFYQVFVLCSCIITASIIY